jgi:hypothetical protein
LAPLWVSLPFQSEDTVWPLGKDHVKVQLDQLTVPVFSIVMLAPKAVLFCGDIVYTTLHAFCAAAVNAVAINAARTIPHARRMGDFILRYLSMNGADCTG